MYPSRINIVANNTPEDKHASSYEYPSRVSREFSFALSFINLVNDRRSKLTETPESEKE